MNKEDLKKTLRQIKKYELTKNFKDNEEFDNWLKKLTQKQIKNLNSLNIEPNEIKFPKELIINENLLNCDDYLKRITAMINIKNGEGCWHLFDRLCNKEFLESKNYYQDMLMISKGKSPRYALWVIDKPEFINSVYHNEDLRLIINAKDNEDGCDYLVAEALAMVAKNSESINSMYHRHDMMTIAENGSKCLQPSGTRPKNSTNALAINVISLKDKYHKENMQILSKNPLAKEFLYKLMTNSKIINGKYYRQEIEALLKSTSIINAIAIYFYITNPKEDSIYNFSTIDFYEYDYPVEEEFNYAYRYNGRLNNQEGNNNPKYLENLELLNKIDEKKVMYYESILSNIDSLNSQYQEYDLEILNSINDKNIILDLFEIMTNKTFLSSPHHIQDINLISQATDQQIRNLLIRKATDELSIKNPNHEYDMNYISKLNIKKIDAEIYHLMIGYLFNYNNTKDHIDVLEKLSKGKISSRG